MATQTQSTTALSTETTNSSSEGSKSVKVRAPHFLKIARALFGVRRQPEFGFDEWKRIERVSFANLPRNGSEYRWLRGS